MLDYRQELADKFNQEMQAAGIERFAFVVTDEMLVRQARTKWGFCPSCGLPLGNQFVKWHHEHEGCPAIKQAS